MIGKRVSNTKNKEYYAEEAFAAAKVTGENVDDRLIVYEQCRRIADSDVVPDKIAFFKNIYLNFIKNTT